MSIKIYHKHAARELHLLLRPCPQAMLTCWYIFSFYHNTHSVQMSPTLLASSVPQCILLLYQHIKNLTLVC